jgi:hypothetical protein
MEGASGDFGFAAGDCSCPGAFNVARTMHPKKTEQKEGKFFKLNSFELQRIAFREFDRLDERREVKK